MNEQLFDHIDILPENYPIPDGSINQALIKQHCVEYNIEIEANGNVDFQLLGLERNGHIGFNEPVGFIRSVPILAIATSVIQLIKESNEKYIINTTH